MTVIKERFVENAEDSAVKYHNLVQASVARLLAEENITVVRHNQNSAFFNLETRVLTIPNYDFKKNTVISEVEIVCIAHEVGHAKYTKDDHAITRLLNIIEDVRIERLLKRNYPGLRQAFNKGYSFMYNELDFFGCKDMTTAELNQFSFLDRLNLDSKVGASLGITFSAEEQVWVDRARSTETWEDVIQLMNDMKKWLQKKNKEQQQQQQPQMPKFVMPMPPSGDDEGEGEEGEGEDGDSQPTMPEGIDDEPSEEPGEEGEDAQSSATTQKDKSEEKSSDEKSDSGETKPLEEKEAAKDVKSSKETEEEKSEEEQPLGSGKSKDKDNIEKTNSADSSNEQPVQSDDIDDNAVFGSHTMDSLDKNLNESVSKRNIENFVLGKIHPDALGMMITNNLDSSLERFNEYQTCKSYILEMPGNFTGAIDAVKFNERIGKKYIECMQRTKKAARVMYKEFALRKNASERLFDRVETTGKLNVKKLSQYRTSDKIFKSRVTKHTAESHALVLVLDVSASTRSLMPTMLEQLLTSVEFCRLANIPYKVYAYSSYATAVPLDSPFMTKNPTVVEYSWIEGAAKFNPMTNGNISPFTPLVTHQDINKVDQTAKVVTPAVAEILNSSLSAHNHNMAMKMLYQTLMHGTCGSLEDFKRSDIYKNVFLNYIPGLYRGTSTYSTLLALENQVNEFFAKTSKEKRNVVVITDGSPTDDLTTIPTGFALSTMQHLGASNDKNYYETLKTLIDSATRRVYNCETQDIQMTVLDCFKQRTNSNVSFLFVASKAKHAYEYSPTCRVLFRTAAKKKGMYIREYSRTVNHMLNKDGYVTMSNSFDIPVILVKAVYENYSNTGYDEIISKDKSSAVNARAMVKAMRENSANRPLLEKIVSLFTY